MRRIREYITQSKYRCSVLSSGRHQYGKLNRQNGKNHVTLDIIGWQFFDGQGDDHYGMISRNNEHVSILTYT